MTDDEDGGSSKMASDTGATDNKDIMVVWAAVAAVVVV